MHPAGLGAWLLASALAHKTQVHATVTVTASRLPAEAAAPRRTVVLEREEIARLPVGSVQELVAHVLGGGLVRRGPLGVQADLQLRGTTFEQAVVLVDGVRVNDPQTGHFTLDLPVDLEAVERIEVTLGPGSAVHGPGAFGGTVAIVTGPPAGPRVRLSGGQNGFWSGQAALPLGAGAWVSVGRTTHDGYRPDTDLEARRATLGWSSRAGAWSLRTSLGTEAKRFGAWAYYSSTYPNQWEKTDTGLLTVAASRPVGNATLTLRTGARQHHDTFVLDRTRPDWYQNRHRSRTAQGQAVLSGESAGVRWVAGVEGEGEALASSRLGDHRRDRFALFAEGGRSFGRLTVGGQARGDRMSGLGWEVSPGLGLELDLGGGATLSAHRGRSFRQPSFTDLYYESPATVGNPALRPEQAWSDELLLRLPVSRTLVELSVFQRDARHLIDFLRGDDGVYRAANHARVVTSGAEWSMQLPGADLLGASRIWASWLHSEVDVDPSRSRYALAHPKWEAGASTRVTLPAQVTGDLACRWRQPRTGGSYSLVDARLSRTLGRGLGVELTATNLFATRYLELDGIPMPGRWVVLGLTWQAR
ncbi:MAG TPA: TonB-dependent receptor [Thermoanaerobaculaceae bacterium]|nr:TonB-dependent receptor [Thermoanaerobaculaceae bacterium]